MPLAELIPLVRDLSPSEKLSLFKILAQDIPETELKAFYSSREAASVLAEMTDPDDEPAELVLDSLKQAWGEVQVGRTRPLSELWDDEDE
ncbi:hypothetical protein POG22_03305 [Geitlerinema sp. CS-897]|nr:hypothetical protein [Geitlerinema sp. CS-897]